MAEVGSAWVTVAPDAKGFGRDLDKQVSGDLGKSGKTIGKRFGSAIKVGAVAVAGGAAALTGFLKGSLDEAREAQKVGALTNAVIKSTGGAAGVTAKQVGDLAGALSRKTGIDDEVIQSGQNMLLTFKNVRNEAGKGNDIFNQSTTALIDMAAAMGTEPKQAAIQLGKALNDPIKGISALSRVGITFTEGQKKQIKAMQESGNIMGAQKIILRELNSQFKGAAEAQATAGDKARVAWGNLQETIGTALIPVVDRAANLFTNKIAPAVEKFVTEMQTGTGAGGAFVDKLRTIYGVGQSVVGFFRSLPGPVRSFGLQMGLTLLVMGRMRSLLGPITTGLAGFVTGVGNSTTRLAALKSVSQTVGAGLRNLAGAGGLMMVADSGNRASKAMGALQGAAGGALAGASLGAFAGPPGAAIGAAIGGLAGGLFGLSNSAKRAGTSAEVSVSSWQNLASTLDEVTGKATQATRQLVMGDLRKSGVLDTLTRYGISAREAVNAITRGGPAQAKFVGNLTREKSALEQSAAAAKDRHRIFLNTELDPARRKAGIESYETYLKQNRAQRAQIDGALKLAGATSKAVEKKREDIAATREYSGAIKTLPKRVQTEIKEKGLKPTRAGVVDLTRRFNLVPKDVRTLIRENGGKPTKAMVQGIIKDAKNLGAQKPTPKIGERGGAATRKSLNSTAAAAKALDRISPNIPVNVSGGALGALNNIQAAMNRLRANPEVLLRIRAVRSGAGLNVAGARAHGGPVEGGKTYLVGERGPELFTASQRGQIIPNHELSRAAASMVTQNIYTSDPIRAAREANRQLAWAGAV